LHGTLLQHINISSIRELYSGRCFQRILGAGEWGLNANARLRALFTGLAPPPRLRPKPIESCDRRGDR
jgi:hypothetical protein